MSGDRPYSISGDHSACTCSVSVSQRSPKWLIAFSIGSNGSAGVASMANSISSWNGSGNSVAPASQKVASSRSSSATCMRFCVSVPVLSTASTEIAPSVSTAGTRRVSTLCFEIRQAPRARNTVSTTGISSGRIAMVSATPDNTLSMKVCPSHNQLSRQ